MKPLFATILLLSAIAASCSNADLVEVQVVNGEFKGRWVGTVGGTSVTTWELTESPVEGGTQVEGTGQIRGVGCETAIRITGERVGNDGLLLVTIDDQPDFRMSVSGSFLNERFEGIYFIESGSLPLECLPDTGGVVRIGERAKSGLNGEFRGSWLVTPDLPGSFSDTVPPYAMVHMVQTGSDVWGTVDWFGGYPCAEQGFLVGTFDGTEFLANVYSSNASDAYHLLEADWDARTDSMQGISTLLSPGPSPSCPLLGEAVFSMQLIEAQPLELAPQVIARPLGTAHRVDEEGRWIESGVLFRLDEPSAD